MSVAISIRLPDELADHLKGIAKETDRPRSYIIQKAIEVYLEDYSDLQVALDRLRDKSMKAASTATIGQLTKVGVDESCWDASIQKNPRA